MQIVGPRCTNPTVWTQCRDKKNVSLLPSQLSLRTQKKFHFEPIGQKAHNFFTLHTVVQKVLKIIVKQ